MGEEDERTLVHLLTDQIEFADVVILNKVSDAGPERTDAARKIIRSLNADAEIIETDHSEVAAAKILDTGMFDFDKAHEHPSVGPRSFTVLPITCRRPRNTASRALFTARGCRSSRKRS